MHVHVLWALQTLQNHLSCSLQTVQQQLFKLCSLPTLQKHLCSCLQTVVSRGTSPLECNVVSLTSFNMGGNAYNVIPNTMTLDGTYRPLAHAGIL